MNNINIDIYINTVIQNKRTEELRNALEKGLNPNYKLRGTPLLQIASAISLTTLHKEHWRMVKLLLHYGADPLLPNTKGKSAVDLLIEKDINQVPFPSFPIKYRKI